MHLAYIILDYISVFVMIGCVVVIATHESGKMQKLAMLACTMLLFCCTGFLIKAEATTANVMIVGQKIVYATVTHSMLLMLLFILEYCHFSLPKFLEWICHGINLAITAVVLTLDHHNWFYVDYWAEEVNGNFELMKEYGPMHTVAVVVFGLYMALVLAAAIEFSVKNIRERSRYVWSLLIAVALPCLAYIIPKITDTVNELQPIAFALFTIMLLVMVYKSKIYDVNDIAAQYTIKSVNNAMIVFGQDYSYKGCNEVALTLFPFLQDTSIDKNLRDLRVQRVQREQSDFLCDCVDGKVKDYPVGDKIYGVTVKPVISGDMMIGRVVWFEDVTIERNYTKLLKEQKKDLETQVDTLYGISNTDEMTQLGNRRAYEQLLSEIREKDEIPGLVVAELDINGLKEANDTIGHRAGDELIIGTSDIMKNVFGKCGKLFRTGGDEFFVIIEGGNVNVDTLKAELEAAVKGWHGTLVNSLSISFGFCSAEDYPDKNIDELMDIADEEMYKSKAEYYSHPGRDRRHFLKTYNM